MVLQALGWLAGAWLLWSVPRCRPAGDGRTAGSVSVVIPARDEEANLAPLLDSLRTQDGVTELVVVDDHSGDDTAGVARRGGAAVVACDPLPKGWTGKSWACWTGAKSTGGDTLVFLDADTELAPGGLGRVLAEHAAHGGLLSVQPFHRTERPYEALSAFFNVVAMMAVEGFTPLRHRRPARGAFGPCLVCTRADYLRSGGHQAVAGEVVEDVALARRFVAAGLPVTCMGGRGTISFRMYPRGLAQLVEGWSKNFAAGAEGTRPVTSALVSAWLGGCITAAAGLGPAIAGGGAARRRAALSYLAYAAQLSWMLRRTGSFGWWTAALYPAPLAGFLAIFARSLVLTKLRQEVRWKGRLIRV